MPLPQAGCGTIGPAPPCRPASAGAAVVYLVDHGWHTDIGVPAAELSGTMAGFRAVFPGARAVLFGFGKRTFLTAKTDRWEEFLVGPFPGPGAMLVAGLAEPPDAAFGVARTVKLVLPPGGAPALSAFLARSFATDRAGRPLLIARGPWVGSLFYAARDTYALGNTCNDWSLRALRAAGLPVSAAGVLLAGQAMHRARVAAACPLPATGLRSPA